MPRIIPIPAQRLRRVFEPEVPVFIIKNNLRTAGLTREEYFSLLEEV